MPENFVVLKYNLRRTDIDRKPWQKKGSVRFSHADFVNAALGLLREATKGVPHNLIIRPHDAPDVTLVQLDNLKPDALRRVAPFAFLSLETSPANFQALIGIDSVGGIRTQRRPYPPSHQWRWR